MEAQWLEGMGEDLQAGFFTNIMLLNKMLVLPPNSFFFFPSET